MNGIIYFGSNAFGIPSLEELKKRCNLLGVVTAPDRPRGRGLKVSCTDIKEWATRNNVPVFQPESLSDGDFKGTLRSVRPEFIVLISYGRILPSSILEIPSLAAINVHPSLLPQYRGAAPMEWALINGEKETGLTVMVMHDIMDAGHIMTQKKIVIDEKDDIFSLRERLSRMAPEILLDSMKKFREGIKPSPQRGTPTYARKLAKEDGLIRWDRPVAEIHNLIRGTKEWPGAYTYLDGRYFKIFRSEPVDGYGISGEPGTVIGTGQDNDSIYVACLKGVLKIEEVQVEGKRRMPAAEFLRGCRIRTGDRFSGTR